MLAKQGVRVAMSDLFGVGGQKLLDELQLDGPYAAKVTSLRRLIDATTFEIDVVAKRVGAELASHRGYRAVERVRIWRRSSMGANNVRRPCLSQARRARCQSRRYMM